jgi:hypothetical protein
MADLVDFILTDMGIGAGKGIGSKEILPAAVKFWSTTYRKSVKEAIKNGAVYKKKDRRAVLLMSVKLGRTARKLAKKGKITKAVAKKASKIIALDPTCGAGGGRFCPVR